MGPLGGSAAGPQSKGAVRTMKRTQRRIEDLQCPAGRRDMMVFDDEQTGLGVRVTGGADKGSLAKKFFLAQYRHAGQKRRVPLGSCSAISLAGARDAVRVILGDVAKGRDPAGERKEAARQAKREAAHQALTLAALLEQWGALCLADKRERYAAEAVRAVRVGFEKRLPLPAAELNRAAVVRVLDDLTKDGKVAMASRTAAYGRACYQWAIRRGALEINPFANLPLTPVAKRDRVLSDAELAAVWKATDGPGTFNAIVRMLMLTGQRREEVTAMTWDEIVGDLATWIVPASRAKNGAAHLVPLSSQAQAILRVAPRVGTGLVFPGRNGPFNGFSKAKEALDKVCGVKDWRLHDLRRTMATGLQRLGVRLEVTEAVLNHVAGSRAGIVGVYQRHHWADEKRAALTAWGARVAAMVDGGKAEGNVVPFAREGSG
jgi:integrase